MRYFLLLFLWLPLVLKANVNALFSDDDLSLCHNVNVISGNLNLQFQDAVIEGAIPLPIVRTYTSEGALERFESNQNNLSLSWGKWLIQGGWNFMPHIKLIYQHESEEGGPEIFLAEKSGTMIHYIRESSKKGIDYFRPKESPGACSGVLGARTNPGNNRIEVDTRNWVATLYLPDGGKRSYARPGGSDDDMRLVDETLPSKHIIAYRHSGRKSEMTFKLMTPSRGKELSWAKLSLIKSGVGNKHFRFDATSSDGKCLQYRSINWEGRNYLSDVQSNCRPRESSHFLPSRRGKGLRMRSFTLGSQTQFLANYLVPTNKGDERKWAQDYEKKPLWLDRVHSIDAPVGPNGEMAPVAIFSYYENATDVRDVEGVLTVYHHDKNRLTKVEYFDEKGVLESVVQLIWDGQRLIGKVMLNNRLEPLFSRTFRYDAQGNVLEEKFWGNLTGEATGTFVLEKSGELAGAESYTKRYNYLPEFNVPVFEEEEDGTTYRYQYLPGTDLTTAKFLYDKGKMVVRQFFFYDADHFLVKEITDDGSSENPYDLANVTERNSKSYEIDAGWGVKTSVTETYWDAESGGEKLLRKVRYHYCPTTKKIRAEDVYDAEGALRYTIHTDYDAYGRVVRKTTPLGQDNTYVYSEHGNLLASKEVGSLKKTYGYTPTGSPTYCEEWDGNSHVKITRTHYDAKGRLVSQTDSKGNETRQKYDVFGRCIETEFPAVQNRGADACRPTLRFIYDVLGNLVSTTAPLGETTHTRYNAYGKPILITHPDGTKVRHVYNAGNMLRQTHYPDGSHVEYTYDYQQRTTSEVLYSACGEVLSQELWHYNAFHLLSHSDPRGLETKYTYDGAGRVVEENAGGRIKRYVYDSLGHVQSTTVGPVTTITLCDVGGRVVDTWEEDGTGSRENHMTFTYDAENRKREATRITSVGQAVDYFDYDVEGRLCKHTDPEGQITEFIYNELARDSLGQQVLEKTTIDPLGNRKIETYDALSKLTCIENQNPQQVTVGKEEYFYDASGNRISRTSYVYDENRLIREICTEWEYDAMGRVCKEVESGERTTLYTYDVVGRVETKTLNRGIVLSYRHDGLGRMLEQKSSDGTIHYEYRYKKGAEPVEIRDRVRDFKLARRYNLFGQIEEETNPSGLIYSWEYDDFSRCISFTLPDNSCIDYAYCGRHMSAVTRCPRQGKAHYEHRYTQFDPNGHVQEEELILSLGTVKTERDLMERLTEQNSRFLRVGMGYGPSGLVSVVSNSLFGSKTYSYDPLNQLILEGEQPYFFDSLGNPSHWQVNQCNQILSTPSCTLRYDPDGNPIQREESGEATKYSYDALGRLVQIQMPSKTIIYTYDPLSRLLSKETKSKWWGTSKHLYLYDNEYEIGTISLKNEIQQLKVLGLGLKGDIGAAVAIEIKGAIYAPLHDFSGNILAIVSSAGRIAKTYQMDAFGKQKGDPDDLNPWQFSSKRCEENLVFFGLRFYDPSLGRWLTPDPSGFSEGPNLYIYALNSPINRLDLFGLESEGLFPWRMDPDSKIDVSIDRILAATSIRDLIPSTGSFGGVESDLVVASGHWHKLQFSAEEKQAGKINILDHLHELIPKNGSVVGAITAQNGINTSFREFKRTGKEIMGLNVEGALFVGLHNPSEGLIKDLFRVRDERRGIDTPIVVQTRQFLENFIGYLSRVNPEILVMHISHSEGGLIGYRAIKGMAPESKKLMQEHVLSFSFGPAHPIPKEFCQKAENIYSRKDYITGRYGKKHRDDPAYDIQRVKCTSTICQRTAFIADHGINGNTYSSSLNLRIEKTREKYGFYDGKDR